MKKYSGLICTLICAAALTVGFASCDPVTGGKNKTEVVIKIQEPLINEWYKDLEFPAASEIKKIEVYFYDANGSQKASLDTVKTVSFKDVEPGENKTFIYGYDKDGNILTYNSLEGNISKNTKGTTGVNLSYIAVILKSCPNDGKIYLPLYCLQGEINHEVDPETKEASLMFIIPRVEDDKLKNSINFCVPGKQIDYWEDNLGNTYAAEGQIDMTGKKLPLELKAYWK